MSRSVKERYGVMLGEVKLYVGMERLSDVSKVVHSVSSWWPSGESFWNWEIASIVSYSCCSRESSMSLASRYALSRPPKLKLRPFILAKSSFSMWMRVQSAWVRGMFMMLKSTPRRLKYSSAVFLDGMAVPFSMSDSSHIEEVPASASCEMFRRSRCSRIVSPIRYAGMSPLREAVVKQRVRIVHIEVEILCPAFPQHVERKGNVFLSLFLPPKACKRKAFVVEVQVEKMKIAVPHAVGNSFLRQREGTCYVS